MEHLGDHRGISGEMECVSWEALVDENVEKLRYEHDGILLLPTCLDPGMELDEEGHRLAVVCDQAAREERVFPHFLQKGIAFLRVGTEDVGIGLDLETVLAALNPERIQETRHASDFPMRFQSMRGPLQSVENVSGEGVIHLHSDGQDLVGSEIVDSGDVPVILGRFSEEHACDGGADLGVGQGPEGEET